MTRKTILLVFGGQSSEHDVSIMSARNVYSAMDGDKYQVELCYIDRRGKWWLLDDWSENLDRHGGLQLVAVPGSKSFMTVPGNRILPVEIIFPILHGKNGEDGSVQGLSQMLHIPIIGCGIEASSLCMDKNGLKQLLAYNQIPVSPWLLVRDAESPSLSDLQQQLGAGPWFVKPSRAGSSVGVSKVDDYNQLDAAISLAAQHDDEVLIERAINGRELEIAVLGNLPHHKASVVGEILSGADFYDYDDKYAASSASQTVISPQLDEANRQQLTDLALQAYQLAGCRGLARVDFFLTADGEIYLNEINTMPGFTNISMYPKLWQADGLKYPELIDRLINLALE